MVRRQGSTASALDRGTTLESQTMQEMSNRIDKLENTLNLIVSSLDNLSGKIETQIKGNIGSGIKNLLASNKQQREGGSTDGP